MIITQFHSRLVIPVIQESETGFCGGRSQPKTVRAKTAALVKAYWWKAAIYLAVTTPLAFWIIRECLTQGE